MGDLTDQVQDRDAQQLAEALQAQQVKASLTPKLQPTGECRNPLCCEPLEGDRLFCGPACAQEHARRNK